MAADPDRPKDLDTCASMKQYNDNIAPQFRFDLKGTKCDSKLCVVKPDPISNDDYATFNANCHGIDNDLVFSEFSVAKCCTKKGLHIHGSKYINKCNEDGNYIICRGLNRKDPLCKERGCDSNALTSDNCQMEEPEQHSIGHPHSAVQGAALCAGVKNRKVAYVGSVHCPGRHTMEYTNSWIAICRLINNNDNGGKKAVQEYFSMY